MAKDRHDSSGVPTKRAEAISLGLIHYFTGRPCKHGHVSKRYTQNGICAECNYRRLGQLEKYKAWRAANHENVVKYNVDRYSIDREEINSKCRSYYADNRESVNKVQKSWRIANPDKLRELNHKRRARTRGAEGNHSASDVAKIGSNWPSNLQLLCQPCNSSKQDRDPVEFMQSRGFLI